jgi:hypothetical protein
MRSSFACVACLPIFFACSRVEQRSQGAGGTPTSASSAAAVPSSAGDPADPATVASSAPALSVPAAGAPPWPAGASRFRLTWVLYPVAVDPKSDTLLEPHRRRIELVVRSGSSARRMAMQATFVVSFDMSMQTHCDRSAVRSRDEVGSLSMNGGGNLWFTAKRTGDELAVTQSEQADGMCEAPAGCPVRTQTVGRLAVPEGATFEEHFIEVEGKGHEVERFCGPAPAP